jgi:hypothetical protein
MKNDNSGIARSGLTKKEHYNWDDLDAQCVHMSIPIDKLNVDSSYQRGEASNTGTLEKAKRMQFAAAGAIIVAKRFDGTYWIVDGLQRTLAAKRRGDIKEMQCMVFPSKGKDHEAEVFLLCNKGRVPVCAMHKYKTSVTAGRSPEKEINEWLALNNYSVSDNGGFNVIRFPAKLIQNWLMNPQACKDAILISSQICGEEPNAHIFCGIAILIRNGIDVKSEVQKIISLGGATRIMKEINTLAITLGTSKSLRICGMGILTVINHKRRKKLSVSHWKN